MCVQCLVLWLFSRDKYREKREREREREKERRESERKEKDREREREGEREKWWKGRKMRKRKTRLDNKGCL